MPTSNHHIALRVADAERAADFYEAAFGAKRSLEETVMIEGELAETTVGGPKGTKFRLAIVEFPDGGSAELFEFVEPARPTRPIDAWEGNVMHFAVQVDDVDAALERALAAGGKQIWPEVLDMSGLRIMYIHDLDGNVVELIDGTMADVVEMLSAP